MSEHLRNNKTVWITGIIAVLIMCGIVACMFMFAMTLLFGDVETSYTQLLLTAQE